MNLFADISIEFLIGVITTLAFLVLSLRLSLRRRKIAMQFACLASWFSCLCFCHLPTIDLFAHFLFTVFAYCFALWLVIDQYIRAMAREQLKNELKLYSFDYESVIANPLEFTWLDLNYYDTKQHELESLGFQKIDDSEFLPLTKAFPDIRTFSRRFINAEQDIEASITQIRIKKPAYEYENIQERLLNQRIVKFYSEFSDNTFIETDNTRLITPIKGIELLAFVPTISLEELLDAHEKKIETICETKNVNTIIHRNANEISEAAKRRFLSLGKYLNEKNNITELEFTRIRLIARKYGGYNAVIKTYLAEYNEQVQKKQENELPQS